MELNHENNNFRELFRADMNAMGLRHQNGFLTVGYIFMRNDFLAVLIYRLSSSCYQRGSRFGRACSILLWRLNALLHCCDIKPDAKIGPGFTLPHPFCIVIGSYVSIGNNVEIQQGVTFGRRDTSEMDPPKICMGDNISVGAGAVILSGVTIGSGARIGANAVVTKDVPSNCVAIGVPARAIPRRGLPTDSQVPDRSAGLRPLK